MNTLIKLFIISFIVNFMNLNANFILGSMLHAQTYDKSLVYFTSEPSKASIRINDTFIGKTPVKTQLEAGLHIVDIQTTTHHTQKTIRIFHQKDANFHINLNTSSAQSRLQSLTPPSPTLKHYVIPGLWQITYDHRGWTFAINTVSLIGISMSQILFNNAAQSYNSATTQSGINRHYNSLNRWKTVQTAWLITYTVNSVYNYYDLKQKRH